MEMYFSFCVLMTYDNNKIYMYKSGLKNYIIINTN